MFDECLRRMDVHMSLRGSSFATRQNYLRGLKVLMVYYQKLPESCTVDEIKSYLVYQRDELNISSSTLNVRVCSLKYYFRHIVNRLDLVVKIPNPRVQKFQTEIYTPEELSMLFRRCRDIRQLLMLHLLYDCGLRLGELSRLRACDIDKRDRTITIRNSKGGKTRVVYYGERLRCTLNQYAKVHGINRGCPLLTSYTEVGKGLSLSGLQHLIKEIIRRSGVKKRGSAHTLRHTFAVHYLNRGGSLFSLQLLLGHSQLTTTLGYLKYAKIPDGLRVSVLDDLS